MMQETGGGFAMYRLMIVDDEYEIRNGLRSYFPWDHVGFEVAADFGSAAEALAYLREQPVDAVLTDVRMPDMDGLEMIRAIRRRGLNMPIVVVSGYREFDYAQQAMACGVRHYVVKPTRTQNLIDVFTQVRKELDEAAAPLRSAQPERQGADSTDVVRRIQQYIAIHVQDATLASIADYVRMNPYYLSSFYHQQTGEKLSDYLFGVRMQRAGQLLRETDERIAQIAQEVGYTTSNSFSRGFSQYYGMTPREYRTMNGEVKR